MPGDAFCLHLLGLAGPRSPRPARRGLLQPGTLELWVWFCVRVFVKYRYTIQLPCVRVNKHAGGRARISCAGEPWREPARVRLKVATSWRRFLHIPVSIQIDAKDCKRSASRSG